jgi:hypothetical protein
MLLTNEALQSIKTQIVIEVSLYGLVNLTLVFSYKYLVYLIGHVEIPGYLQKCESTSNLIFVLSPLDLNFFLLLYL